MSERVFAEYNFFSDQVAEVLKQNPEKYFATLLSGQSVASLRSSDQLNGLLATHWHVGDSVEWVSNHRTHVIIRRDNPFKDPAEDFDPSDFKVLNGSVNQIVELVLKYSALNPKEEVFLKGWDVLTTTVVDGDRMFSVSCSTDSNKLSIEEIDPTTQKKYQFLHILVPARYNSKQLME